MVGGAQAAFALGKSDLAAHLPTPGLAIDLGAGFGMHAVPLARSGWRVVAIDNSPYLLAELEAAAAGLSLTTYCGDLLTFAEQLAPGERANLIVCMGDTLTHLENIESVRQLSRAVAQGLARDGRFIATFRDYTRLPSGAARFIPVRSDQDRILVCFLEDAGDHVQVYDLLHQYDNGSWTTKASSYPKLKLQPEAVREMFAAAGLSSRLEQGRRGMVMLVADSK